MPYQIIVYCTIRILLLLEVETQISCFYGTLQLYVKPDANLPCSTYLLRILVLKEIETCILACGQVSELSTEFIDICLILMRKRMF